MEEDGQFRTGVVKTYAYHPVLNFELNREVRTFLGQILWRIYSYVSYLKIVRFSFFRFYFILCF